MYFKMYSRCILKYMGSIWNSYRSQTIMGPPPETQARIWAQTDSALPYYEPIGAHGGLSCPILFPKGYYFCPNVTDRLT